MSHANYPITVCHIGVWPAMSFVWPSTSSSIQTVWTIQSASLFSLFAILNRTWYLSLLMSVWTQLSCVGFATTRPTLSFDLKRFRVLWIFKQNLIPWSIIRWGVRSKATLWSKLSQSNQSWFVYHTMLWERRGKHFSTKLISLFFINDTSLNLINHILQNFSKIYTTTTSHLKNVQ